MDDSDVAIKGLDWFAELGAPAATIEDARARVLNGAAENQAAPAPAPNPNAAPQSAPDAQTSSASDDPQPSELLAVTVDPPTATVVAGEPQAFAAMFEYRDGRIEDKTLDVVWTSSNAAIPIDGRGMAVADPVSATAQIIATDPTTGLSGVSRVSVAAPAPGPSLIRITITPANPSIFSNPSLFASPTQSKPPMQFNATGAFADKSTKDLTGRVTWRSSDTGLLSIDVNGSATVGFGTGHVTITATDEASAAEGVAIAASATVVVTQPVPASIAINPQKPSIDIEEERNFWITRVYSDGFREDLRDARAKITWTATGGLGVESDGLGFGKTPGPATLTVKDDLSGFSATLQLTVEGVRSVDTPYGEFSYLVPSEGAVKPLLLKAVETFKNAEALNGPISRTYQGLLAAEKGIGALEIVLKEVTQYTVPQTKRDAANATTASILDSGTQAFLLLFTNALESAQKKIKLARKRIDRAGDAEMVLMYQKFAREMDETTDELVALGKVALAAPSAAHNPTEVASAALDLFGAWAKANNPYTEAAEETQKEIADGELQDAMADLKDVRDTVKKLEPQLKASQARVKDASENASNQWATTEKDYDTDPRNKGVFRFQYVREAIPAAKAASAAALQASQAGYGALSAARALAGFNKKPSEWMADVDKDQEIITTLGNLSSGMYEAAIAVHNDAVAMSKRFEEIYEKARKAMAEAPDNR